MPVMILIAVTILAFGPWWGFWYALFGMTASAMLTFWIGRLLGRRVVDYLPGSRVHRISRALAAKGVLTVVTLRILPLAPFSILNAMAGASHIRTRDFFMGTVLGELPGLGRPRVVPRSSDGNHSSPGLVQRLNLGGDCRSDGDRRMGAQSLVVGPIAGRRPPKISGISYAPHVRHLQHSSLRRPGRTV